MIAADMTFLNHPDLEKPATNKLPTIPGYVVLQFLGKGGMGTVWEARHVKLERIVALKLVSAANDKQVLARFEQEVKAVASLKHPNIAHIHESGLVENRPFFAMEYVAGGNLSDRLKAGPLLPQEAAQLLLLLARAMQHAHEQNILHRDLKPSNILLEKGTLNPKIVDFGLAKRLNDDSRLTRTGEIFGSPSYMSPEQASGAMRLSPAVDVYALGAVLYECLTGRPPFLGPDVMQTLIMVLSNDPVPAKQLQPKLPLDLETICMKCLEKSPSKRYASARALADDLERYLKKEPIQARPISSAERLKKWIWRRPWQSVAIVLSIILFISMAVGFFFMQKGYGEVREANKDANQAFALTKHALDNVFRSISDKLSTIPNGEALTLDSYRPAISLYQSLTALRPQDKATVLDYAKLLYDYVLQQIMHFRYDEAAETLQITDKLITNSMALFPDDFELQLHYVKLIFNRAWLARRQSQLNTAQSLEVKTKELLATLLQRYPNDTRLLRLSNELLRVNLNDAIAGEQLDQALTFHWAMLANQEHIYQIEPSNVQASMVMSAQKSLAGFLLTMRNYDEAENVLRSIEQSLTNLTLMPNELLKINEQLSAAHADIARHRKDWKKAETLYQQASTTNQQLRKDYPLDVNYLDEELDLRRKQAELLYDQGKVDQALTELKRYVADAEKIVKEHPDYKTIAEKLKRYQGVLQQYQAEPRKP